jgi:hypothetical protein
MLLTAMLAVGGCQPKWLQEDLEGTRHVWTRLNSNRGGTATVRLPVGDGETALLATAEVEAPVQVHFRALRDPQGQEVFRAFEWNSSAYSKTNGGFVSDTVSLNWPVQEGDPGLFGGRWEFELGVVDGNQQYVAAPIWLDVLLKRDEAFDRGALEASIVYTEDLEDDDDLRLAVDEAKEVWRGLYDAMGIDLTFRTYAFPDGNLGPPAYGDEPAYVDISSDTAPRSVNLVISQQIDGFDDIFGIAGDIPGPLIPTARSAVQVSSLLAAGPDGDFDPEDVRLLGETMAHEVAHFLGLYHPVEQSWDAWDVLPDTPECDTEQQCTDRLSDNLMFPYPVCGPALCLPQDGITDEQAGVANRYVGVD